ncbi:hypothetical protein QJS83_08125 [Bdellovibrio sp. 22V]|uniref:SRPBCC domain-containing protein n=1 Tax=Bdellovibrio TaxID=958 RepID=UPI0025427920|nr:SRPBCC domain-containing protein [Bdellovibrio sp. 22V]WII73843.1 hypothetical protein QJS83_08125 [Bdellovibrio sp. 22V]
MTKKTKKKILPAQVHSKLAGVTTETVLKSTGKTWDQWIEILNKAGAKSWQHKEIAAYLKNKRRLKGWWHQWVAIGYETAVGMRAPGRNLKGEYSITVTRTVHVDHKIIWKMMMSEEGLAIWLKPVSKFTLQPKAHFETDAGVFGEIRTMLANRRVRFTWQEGDWDKGTVVQMYLIPLRNKPGSTIICFMHEKLRDGRMRDPLREYWSQIAEELVARAQAKV